MYSIKWDKSFSVGHLLMDTHHQIFFDIVKQFADSPDKTYTATEQRINFLVEYTVMHLRAEERLMMLAGYPDLEQHQNIHRAFAEKVLMIRDRYVEHPGSVPAENVLKLMQHWFMNHILEEDCRYGPYMQRLEIPLKNHRTLEFT